MAETTAFNTAHAVPFDTMARRCLPENVAMAVYQASCDFCGTHVNTNDESRWLRNLGH